MIIKQIILQNEEFTIAIPKKFYIYMVFMYAYVR